MRVHPSPTHRPSRPSAGVRALGAAVLVLVLAACPGPDEEAAPPNQARVDSAVAESGLPGSKSVGRALDAAGQMQDRADRLDSMNRR